MKRTSLNIDESVFKEIKELAAEKEMSQTALLKLILSDGIRRLKQSRSDAPPPSLPVSGEGGLLEGLDLGERARVWDMLDERVEKLR